MDVLFWLIVISCILLMIGRSTKEPETRNTIYLLAKIGFIITIVVAIVKMVM